MYYRQPQQRLLGSSVNTTSYGPTDCHQASQYMNLETVKYLNGDSGGTVVKALCYKSESRWLDSSWCHWNFH